jgi:hypothetical protein
MVAADLRELSRHPRLRLSPVNPMEILLITNTRTTLTMTAVQ